MSNSKAREKWSAHEEALFLESIDPILKSSLWGQVKDKPELAKRGANGIRAHWDAMVCLPLPLIPLCHMQADSGSIGN